MRSPRQNHSSAVYVMLRQCTIPPLIECPDKAEMYRDSAGHHPHLIPHSSAVYVMLRQCTIPPLIECPDKAEMYRDSAGHHPHLIPPLHLANSFGALSPNYPTEQLNLKHGRMAYPAKRDSFHKLSNRTTHCKISQDSMSC